jgi:tetraacyldisaccharide 4'-kinase
MRPPAFWQHGGWPAQALTPLGTAIDRVTTRRRERTRPFDPGVPVICVGNVTLGGAGKTPVAMDLALRMRKEGWKAHVLARGYRGREGRTPRRVDAETDTAAAVGDESLLLARVAPTWVAPDRIAGAQAAIADGADLLVLDDGFQSARLQAVRNVLVIDGPVGFGNGHVVPAGPLRERPERALARADAVVRLGPDGAGVDRAVPKSIPLLSATTAVDGDAHWLQGARVVAFAGIGRPGKLFDTLAEAGAEIMAAWPFADHHTYTRGELAALAGRAKQADAHLVTTMKDYVRLPPAMRERVKPISVRLVWDDAAAVTNVFSGIGHHGRR